MQGVESPTSGTEEAHQAIHRSYEINEPLNDKSGAYSFRM